MSFGSGKLEVIVGTVIAAFAGAATGQEFPGLGVLITGVVGSLRKLVFGTE